MKDFYKILGIQKNATEQEIKTAYRNLALRGRHPDKGGNTESMQELVAAYEALKDPQKRAEYDRRFENSIEEIDAEFTRTDTRALFQAYGEPFSTSFLHKHADLIVQYQKNPVSYGASKKHFKHFDSKIYHINTENKDYGKYSDIYTVIRIKNRNFSDVQLAASLQNAIDTISEELTPELAIEILTDFLEGDYFGKAIPKLAAHFKSAAAISKENNLKEEMLYEGIYIILSEYKSAPTLLNGLKKITDYIKQTAPISMTYCALLLQNKYFRNLFSYALHHQWKATDDHIGYLDILSTYIAYIITLTHLHRVSPYIPIFVLNLWAALLKPKLQQLESSYFTGFNGIELGRKHLNTLNQLSALFIEDTQAQEDFSRNIKVSKLLYFFDKDINANAPILNSALEHRTRGYKILDWLPALRSSTSNDILANLLIQAGLQFQQAAQCLNTDEVKMADEHLALLCYTQAISLSRKASLNVELYAHIQCLKYITHFQFDFPELKTTIPQLQERCLWIADMFPLLESEQSHFELYNQTTDMLFVMRSLLHTLVNIIQANKNAHEYDRVEIDHEYVKVLYHAYAACIQQWYQDQYGEHDEYDEDEIRISLMESLLNQNKWEFHHVNKNLQSPWVMVARDANGWLRPGRSLSIPQSVVQTFSSIDGITVNQNTGEIVFTATPWDKKQPPNNRVLTLYDLHEMLQKNITYAVFSLDPPDRHMTYHPYNQMRIIPSALYQTDFSNTMFLTDYALKHLTVGEEARGEYPFDMRSVANLLNNIPKHLQKIIYDFHQSQKKESNHRFWIEAQEVQAYVKNENLQYSHLIKLAIPEVKMVVKQHMMKRNLDGTLVDEEEQEEGWQIYVKNNIEQIRAMNHECRPTMVFLQDTAQLYFIEDKQLSGPINITRHSEKLATLFQQERSDDGRVLIKDNNNAFLYHLIKSLSIDLKKHHHFSPEYVFTQEFTEHYDEFAKYLPEFERLKQLSRITVFIRLMNSLNKGNNDKIDELENLFHSTDHWQERKTSIDQAIVTLNTQYQTAYQKEYDRLNGLIASELTRFRNELNKITLLQKKRNVLTELKNKINDSVTVSSHNRQAIIDQLYGVFPAGLKIRLGESSYRQLLNSFLDGNNNPLAQALVDIEFDHAVREICKAYTGITENELKQVISGEITVNNTLHSRMVTPLATEHLATFKIAVENEIARVSRFIEEEKADLRKNILALKKIKITLYQLGIGTTPDEIDLKDTCLWVPASIGRNSNYLVYGGVQINPNIKVEQADTQNLQIAMKQAFSAKHAYINAQGLLDQTRNKDTRAPLNPLYYMRLQENYTELRRQGKSPDEAKAQLAAAGGWKGSGGGSSSGSSSSGSSSSGSSSGSGGKGGKDGNDNDRPNAPNPDHRYKPEPPDKLPGFDKAKRAKSMTPDGAGKLRKRWKLPDDRILEWDSRHGDLEMYNPSGRRHMGSFDPVTGTKLKPRDKKKNISKYVN